MEDSEPEKELPVQKLPAALVREPLDQEGEDKDSTPSMTIGEHLEDLRRRLIKALAGLAVTLTLALIFGAHLIRAAEYPFTVAMRRVGMTPQLSVLGVTEAFSTYLRLATYAGLLLASPWIFYQLWMFVGAGLYKHEKKYVQLAVPFSVLLFVMGAAFGTYVSIPAIEFFIRFGADLNVTPIITLTQYITFMTQLLLVFGIVFQMPLVVLVLAKVGLVSMSMLHRFRRHVIVGIAAIAAIFAPADPFSMLVMMACMWALYEGGIVLAWALVLRKSAKEEAILAAQDAAYELEQEKEMEE